MKKKLLVFLFIFLVFTSYVLAEIIIVKPSGGIFDTNATTECSVGEYLDGGGYCPNLNASIDTRIAITYYNATSIDIHEGTDNTNDLTALQTYDGVTYNISEAVGAPAMDVRINFTGVVDFNQLTIRMRTTSGGKHRYKIQIYDYDEVIWEDYTNFVEIDVFKVMDLGVYDSSGHIDTGDNDKVQVRFYLEDSGIPAHEVFIDWIVLSLGPATFSTTEVDPLSFHKGENINNTGYNGTFDNFQIGTFYINSSGGLSNSGNNIVFDSWVDLGANNLFVKTLLSPDGMRLFPDITADGNMYLRIRKDPFLEWSFAPGIAGNWDLGDPVAQSWRNLHLSGDANIGGSAVVNTINSTSWLNVSITESQISDLAIYIKNNTDGGYVGIFNEITSSSGSDLLINKQGLDDVVLFENITEIGTSPPRNLVIWFNTTSSGRKNFTLGGDQHSRLVFGGSASTTVFNTNLQMGSGKTLIFEPKGQLYRLGASSAQKHGGASGEDAMIALLASPALSISSNLILTDRDIGDFLHPYTDIPTFYIDRGWETKGESIGFDYHRIFVEGNNLTISSQGLIILNDSTKIIGDLNVTGLEVLMKNLPLEPSTAGGMLVCWNETDGHLFLNETKCRT